VAVFSLPKLLLPNVTVAVFWYLNFLLPRTFAPRMQSSSCEIFALQNVCSLELSFLGTLRLSYMKRLFMDKNYFKNEEKYFKNIQL